MRPVGRLAELGSLGRCTGMNALHLTSVFLGLAILAGGCKRQATVRAARTYTYPPQMEITVALPLAIQEARKRYNLDRPYDLDARIDSNGAWFISFEFLPASPGDNAYAIVSTNGVRVFDLP